MKFLVYIMISLISLSSAMAGPQIQIDWNRPENRAAKLYRSTFDAEAVRVARGEAVLLGQRYLMINPGCGSECQAIGYYDIQTGKAYLSKIESTIGIEYSADSWILTVNPPKILEEMF